MVYVVETWTGDADSWVKISGDPTGVSWVFDPAGEHLHGVWRVSAEALHAGVGEQIAVGQVGLVCPTRDEQGCDNDDETATVGVSHWGRLHVNVRQFEPYGNTDTCIPSHVESFRTCTDELGWLGSVKQGTQVRVLKVEEYWHGALKFVLLLIEEVLEEGEDYPEPDDYDKMLSFDELRSHTMCSEVGGDTRPHEIDPEEVGRGCLVTMDSDRWTGSKPLGTEDVWRSAVWLDAACFMPQTEAAVEDNDC